MDGRSLASKRSRNTCVQPATLLLCPAGHVQKPLGVQKLLTNIKIPRLIMANLSRSRVRDSRKRTYNKNPRDLPSNQSRTRVINPALASLASKGMRSQSSTPRWSVLFVRDHFVIKLLYGSIWPTLHFIQRTIKIPYSEKPPSRPHPAVPLVPDTIAISASKPSRATKPSRCTCRLRLMHPRISRWNSRRLLSSKRSHLMLRLPLRSLYTIVLVAENISKVRKLSKTTYDHPSMSSLRLIKFPVYHLMFGKNFAKVWKQFWKCESPTSMPAIQSREMLPIHTPRSAYKSKTEKMRYQSQTIPKSFSP